MASLVEQSFAILPNDKVDNEDRADHRPHAASHPKQSPKAAATTDGAKTLPGELSDPYIGMS